MCLFDSLLCCMQFSLCFIFVHVWFHCICGFCFFFQAEDGIRDAQESRGLGDVYKRQARLRPWTRSGISNRGMVCDAPLDGPTARPMASSSCLLYTSDAADDLLCVDLGGRRIIKKKKSTKQQTSTSN